jgi:choline dehydrogenase-like flavoprotein
VSIATRFPAAADTIVVGGGTAGAVVAGRLAAGSGERTLLLEAGPDYGPLFAAAWRQLRVRRVGLDELTPFQRACADAGADGRVHGIEGLYVADASLMPAVTSGNTNMPVTVIGERIARSLLAP